MMARLAPTQPASLPQKSAPKNAVNWISRITCVSVETSSSKPPRSSGAAANVDDTAITVWMPSL